MLSCKSSKSKITDNQIKALETLIENRNFTIKSDMAYPQVTNAMQQVLNSGLLQPGSASNAISLIGNTNFLTISGDSITSYLPYYGERQMSVGYGGGDSTIELKGVMQDYSVIQGKHNSYIVKFKAKSNSENFQAIIRVFPSLKTDMQLLGTSRFSISYSGRLESLDK